MYSFGKINSRPFWVVPLNGKYKCRSNGFIKASDGRIIQSRRTVPGVGYMSCGKDPQMIHTLFEDDDILAADKPEGIACIPERVKGKENLLSVLESARPGKLYVVHRIDKEASGIVLFAKNAAAHRHVSLQFENRSVRKTYAALTHGVIAESGGRIEKPLRPFGSGRAGVDEGRGKACSTEFHVEARFESCTMVRVHPLTGRRHQIRVHLYSIGHPIAGDPLYGEQAEQIRFPRLMLHARTIGFALPSGRFVTVESALPKTFLDVLESVCTRHDKKSNFGASPSNPEADSPV